MLVLSSNRAHDVGRAATLSDEAQLSNRDERWIQQMKMTTVLS